MGFLADGRHISFKVISEYGITKYMLLCLNVYLCCVDTKPMLMLMLLFCLPCITDLSVAHALILLVQVGEPPRAPELYAYNDGTLDWQKQTFKSRLPWQLHHKS